MFLESFKAPSEEEEEEEKEEQKEEINDLSPVSHWKGRTDPPAMYDEL